MTRGGAAQGRGCERLAAAAPGSPPRHPTPTARGGAGRRAGRCRLPAVPSRRRGRREEDGHRRVVGQRPPRPRRGTGRTNQWRGRRGHQGHAPRPPPPYPPSAFHARRRVRSPMALRPTHCGGRGAAGRGHTAAEADSRRRGRRRRRTKKKTNQTRAAADACGAALSTTGKWKNKGGGGGDESWLAVEVGCVWGGGNGGKWVRTRFVLCAPARERQGNAPANQAVAPTVGRRHQSPARGAGGHPKHQVWTGRGPARAFKRTQRNRSMFCASVADRGGVRGERARAGCVGGGMGGGGMPLTCTAALDGTSHKVGGWRVGC